MSRRPPRRRHSARRYAVHNRCIVYPGALSALGNALTFTQGRPETKTITLVQYGATPLAWHAAEAGPGLKLAASAGTLDGCRSLCQDPPPPGKRGDGRQTSQDDEQSTG